MLFSHDSACTFWSKAQPWSSTLVIASFRISTAVLMTIIFVGNFKLTSLVDAEFWGVTFFKNFFRPKIPLYSKKLR